ncbi:MAG: hypothetical protein F6K16_07410 [Symploca sp. SIO2B6]|nr:hypothetical protein [Symploca sp. SIO2B6]
MSLYLNLSTLCSDDNRLCGWLSVATLVEFVFRNLFGSRQQRIREISKHLPNNYAGSLSAIYPKLDQDCGRYRRKRAIPI